jgi:hypothetical protein
MYVILLIFLFSTRLVNKFESNKLLQSDYLSPDQNTASVSAHYADGRSYIYSLLLLN